MYCVFIVAHTSLGRLPSCSNNPAAFAGISWLVVVQIFVFGDAFTRGVASAVFAPVGVTPTLFGLCDFPMRRNDCGSFERAWCQTMILKRQTMIPDGARQTMILADQRAANDGSGRRAVDGIPYQPTQGATISEVAVDDDFAAAYAQTRSRWTTLGVHLSTYYLKYQIIFLKFIVGLGKSEAPVVLYTSAISDLSLYASLSFPAIK